MLEIQDLHAGYAGMEILHGIALQIKPGKITAIIGPNGSGKSTLLKSIFRLCDITSGKILLDRKEISGLETFELILEGISYVPQGRQVFQDLTVKENLEVGAFTIQDQKVVQENIKQVFEKFPELEKKQSQLAFSLSGGQQQILAIARALMQNPKLLLLDEPSLGLSPKAAKQVFQSIKQIASDGITVVLVEQNAKQAVQISDETIILENGKIAFKGGKSILKGKKMREIYFGGA